MIASIAPILCERDVALGILPATKIWVLFYILYVYVDKAANIIKTE